MNTLSTELTKDGIFIITIDVPDETLNVYNQQLIDDFQQLSTDINHNDAIKAVIFISGKQEGFMAGADIKMLNEANVEEDGKSISVTGHMMLEKITASHKPHIAAIHGVCLGAGYELALACHYRIVSDHPATKVGLPEVMLGLLPGGGGNSKLPRLIALPSALDLLLTGKQLNGRRALRQGLVDEVVPASILLAAAIKNAKRFIKKGKPKHRQSIKNIVMRLPYIKDFIVNKARAQVLKKTKGHYPAPLAILDVVQYGLNKPLEDSLDMEAKFFGELAISPECKQLIKLYFASNELKKETYTQSDIEAKTIQRLGILGGGLMGAGIATVSIDKANTPVRLKDIRDQGLLSATEHIHHYYQQRVKKRILSREAAAKKTNQFTGSLDYSGFAGCDLIIEAVFEDINIKHQMVKDIEALGNNQTIFASNTSSIPISQIAEHAQYPENILGMHYFSPVEKMPLLEIIRHPGTADVAVATAVDFGRKQGKTVIVVEDGPGFYVNRILTPYINAALELGMSGVAFEKIDQALVAFGFPVGPIKLLDEVGIDVGNKILPVLVSAFGKRMQSPGAQEVLLTNKRLGKKVGKGFYRYDDPKMSQVIDESVYQELNITDKKDMDPMDIAEYCVYRMLNEAAMCLAENLIHSARDGDIGAVFGIGFPPFLGGPFRYMDTIGLKTITDKLAGLQASYGDNYQAADILLEKAKDNSAFYT